MQKKYDLKKLKESRETWKKINENCLNADDLNKYRARKEAVDLYIDGAPLTEIEKLTGIKISKVCSFVERCASEIAYGIQFGYTALIPRKRIKSYTREAEMTNEGNFSGAFNNLIQDHPDVMQTISKIYCGKEKMAWDTHMSIKQLHREFLKLLKKKGLTEIDYPFNTLSLGLISFGKYLKSVEDELIDDAINRYGKDAKKHHESTGSWYPRAWRYSRPYGGVQFDAHKIDAYFCVHYIDYNGDEKTFIIDRIWILTLVDIATRACLGYNISIRKEYNQYDILKCINDCILPWKPMKFSIAGLKYTEGAGFPSMLIPEAKWALMDAIYLDNAKQNLSKNVESVINKIGCSLCFGPVKTPVQRSLVERFFKTLEENGFHRIPSTTGSNIKDVRRKAPEKNALKYDITLDHIYEICEAVIADFNNTPHSELGNFTPLEIMRQRLQRGLLPSYVPVDLRETFNISYVYDKRTIRGAKKTGKRPYISFNNRVYSNMELGSSYSQVGQELYLEINPFDVRIITAYREDGMRFGDLKISGAFQSTAFGLKDMEYYNKSSNYYKYRMTDDLDFIADYNENLARHASSNKSCATNLAAIQVSARQSSPESPILPENRQKRPSPSQEAESFYTDEEIASHWTEIKKGDS